MDASDSERETMGLRAQLRQALNERDQAVTLLRRQRACCMRQEWCSTCGFRVDTPAAGCRRHGTSKAYDILLAQRDALAEALRRIEQHAYDDTTSPEDLYADFDHMRDLARAALTLIETAQ